jgi:hypothetical protein
MEMTIRLKTTKLLSPMLPQSPPLYSMCKELTAAAQEWRTRAKMHLACNNAQQVPCELMMRRFRLSRVNAPQRSAKSTRYIYENSELNEPDTGAVSRS